MTDRIVILLILATAYGLAQSPTGTIAGVMKDPAGAAVPAVKITVQHIATGVSRELTTNAQGEYSTPQHWSQALTKWRLRIPVLRGWSGRQWWRRARRRVSTWFW